MPGKPAVHFDLIVGDKQVSQSFYNAIFEWNFTADTQHSGYDWINNIAAPSGGMNPPNEKDSKLILYIHVSDVAQTLQAVQAAFAGATTFGPRPHPLGGSYGYFRDPDGILMGVYSGPLRP
ncbi:MAG: VOC family protein [Planctomycetota bacterium]|jgi:predicted enzyme related to lactoylglutathione lyase